MLLLHNFLSLQRRSISAKTKRYSPPPGTVDEKEIQRHRGSRTSLNSEGGEFIREPLVSLVILTRTCILCYVFFSVLLIRV